VSESDLALRVGVHRAIITPPIGFPLAGTLRDEMSSGVERDLTATALYVSDQDTEAVVVACDLIKLSSEVCLALRQRIENSARIPGGNVLINVSHTHAVPSPPEWYEYEGELPETIRKAVSRYYEHVGDQIVSCAIAAKHSARPARFGWATGEARIGINRREVLPDGRLALGENPKGATDPALSVVRFDDFRGAPLATLFHYGCHPDILGPKATLISPDYVGASRACLEIISGCPAVFIQGAAGDIDPRCGIVNGEDGVDAIRRLGTELGCEAAKLYESINTARTRGERVFWAGSESDITGWDYVDVGHVDSKVRACSRFLQMPLRPLPTLEEAESMLRHYNEELATAKERGGLLSAKLRARRKVMWAEIQRAAVLEGRPPQMDVEISGVAIGDWALIGIPGEIFCEIGIQIRNASPYRHTAVSGYTNGLHFYIPTARAFEQGGYEVESHRNFLQAAGPTREWESMLIRAAVSLLRDMQPEVRRTPVLQAAPSA